MAKKILMIEDDQASAELIESWLTENGYQVSIVGDGVMALGAIRSYAPDLIILDLMLPGGGGFSVLEMLKLSTKTKHIPVVILSVARDAPRKERAIKTGADVFLEKPYDPDVLLATIKKLLKEEQNTAN